MNTTSLTLQAKILGLSVVGVGLLGITIASTLIIDTPLLDAIKINKIFLSTDGTNTNSSTSKIIIDGTSGNITMNGSLGLPGYGAQCPSATGCILTTDREGKVGFANFQVTPGDGDPGPNNPVSSNFFARKGGPTATIDTGAKEIVFYDPMEWSTTNSNIALRVGISGSAATSNGSFKTIDVAGPILSREALSLESPINSSQAIDYQLNDNRTIALIRRSPSTTTPEAMVIQAGHTTDGGTSYDRSDLVIESLAETLKAKVGINTYPSKELDVNGQTLSRGSLTVGSGTNPTLLAHTISKRVGIQTANPRASLDVVGASKFNDSLSIQGTPEHIANITNGMTSITLGEITSNETGNLRTLADVECKLLTVDSNGNLVLQKIPEDICRGTTEQPINPITPTCDIYLPFMDDSIPNQCTLKIKRNGGNRTSTVEVTATVVNEGTYDFTITTGQTLSTESYIIYDDCVDLQISMNGSNSCNNYFRGSGFGLCELNDGDSTLPSSTLGQLISKKEYFCTDSNGGRYDDSLCTQPKPTLSYLGNQNRNNRQTCAPQICTELDTTHGCFTEDTLVTLADGSNKKIQDIVVGDVVKGVSSNNTVLSLIRPTLGNKLLYAINDNSAFVTPNHPFLTIEGWKSLNPEATRIEIPDLEVSLLTIGDTIITTSGYTVITSLTPHTNATDTQLYNFELDGDHTYFANGFAVHNKVNPIGGVAVPLLPSYPDRTLIRSYSCTRNSDCGMTSPGGGSNNHTSQPGFAACDGVEKVCGGNVVPNTVACTSCTQPTSCTTDSQCCGDTTCQTTAQCVGTKVVGSTGPGGAPGPYEGQNCNTLSEQICHSEAYGQSPWIHHGCQRQESSTKTCKFEQV